MDWDDIERAIDGLTPEEREAKRVERRECGSRRDYRKLETAQSIADNIKRRGGPEFIAYQCRFCTGYHVRMKERDA